MTTEEAINRINTEPDFVYLKRLDYSLARVVERFPDGAPDRTIAQALMITPEDVERIYQDIVQRLKKQLADPSL
jgi:hypothetical protein